MGKITREQWSELQCQLNDRLADSAGLLESFRVSMTALFAPLELAARKRADGPFKRKPPISLRLIATGDHPSKLVVLPYHRVNGRRDRRTVTLDCSRMDCELIDTAPEVASPKRITLRLLPCKAVLGRHFYRTAQGDLERVLDVMQDFIDDRRKVLARSHEHCCICGRSLTDELSRSRGIGPECIQGCHRFLNPKGVVREMTLEDVFKEEMHRNPEDSATRLIYADWLEENGRPEEASRQRELAGNVLIV
ncbi:MAG TPA: TIGR02996 domain-containing protein [Gemmataceae bacterium]|jgi:uncharacterized protein (TIGR02996 family)